MQPDGHDGPVEATPSSGAPPPDPQSDPPAEPPRDPAPAAAIDLTGSAHQAPSVASPPAATAPPAIPRPRKPADGGPPTVEMVLDLDLSPDPNRAPVARPASPDRPRGPADTDHLGPPIGRHRASGRQHHWLAVALVCLAVATIAVAVAGGWGRRVPAPDTLPPPSGLPTVIDTDPVVPPGPTSPGPTPTGTVTTTPTRRATPSPTAHAITKPPAIPSPTPSPTPTGPTVLPIPPHTMTVFAASGQCLDDNAQTLAEGNRVQAWECNDTDAQHWAFGSDGTLRFHTLCLRPAGTAAVSGSLMQIRACDGPNRVWQFRSDKSVYNPSSGLCLTDPGLDPHNQLTLATCTPTPSARQQWTVA